MNYTKNICATLVLLLKIFNIIKELILIIAIYIIF